MKNTGKKSVTSAPAVCVPLRGEYNGKPTLTLRRDENDKYPFTFGQAKARLIVAHFDAIRQFANQAN